MARFLRIILPHGSLGSELRSFFQSELARLEGALSSLEYPAPCEPCVEPDVCGGRRSDKYARHMEDSLYH